MKDKRRKTRDEIDAENDPILSKLRPEMSIEESLVILREYSNKQHHAATSQYNLRTLPVADVVRTTSERDRRCG